MKTPTYVFTVQKKRQTTAASQAELIHARFSRKLDTPPLIIRQTPILNQPVTKIYDTSKEASTTNKPADPHKNDCGVIIVPFAIRQCAHSVSVTDQNYGEISEKNFDGGSILKHQLRQFQGKEDRTYQV